MSGLAEGRGRRRITPAARMPSLYEGIPPGFPLSLTRRAVPRRHRHTRACSLKAESDWKKNKNDATVRGSRSGQPAGGYRALFACPVSA